MKIVSFLFLMAFFAFNQSTGHPFGHIVGYVPYGYGAFGYRPNYGTLVQGIPGYPFGQYRGIGSYYGGYRRNYVYGDQVWDNSYGTSVQGIPDETINDPNEKAEYKTDCCNNKKEDQPKRCEDLKKRFSNYIPCLSKSSADSFNANKCRSGQVWSIYNNDCVAGIGD